MLSERRSFIVAPDNGLGRILGASMKKLLVAGIAAAAFLSAPAPAGPPPPATAYDPWTGFYVGGSIGARLSEVDWRNTSFAAGLTTVNNPAALDNTSVRIGGYFGYNWRVAPSWLAGLEADIAWGDNKKTSTPWPGTPFPLSGGHDFVTAK